MIPQYTCHNADLTIHGSDNLYHINTVRFGLKQGSYEVPLRSVMRGLVYYLTLFYPPILRMLEHRSTNLIYQRCRRSFTVRAIVLGKSLKLDAQFYMQSNIVVELRPVC